MYETDLPAKSDHFFTSASLMMSLLFSTIMAAEKQKSIMSFMTYRGEMVLNMQFRAITCVSTFKAVDVPVPLCQVGQVYWQVVVHQLRHVADEKMTVRTRDGRR